MVAFGTCEALRLGLTKGRCALSDVRCKLNHPVPEVLVGLVVVSYPRKVQLAGDLRATQPVFQVLVGLVVVSQLTVKIAAGDLTMQR